MIVARSGCDCVRAVAVASGVLVLVTEGGAHTGHLVTVQDQVPGLLAAQNVVDGHDAVRPRAAGVVDDGGVRLDPDPASTSGHPSVVSTTRLALVEH